MLENLNLSLFSLINATPDSAPWMISLAIFIAKDLITVVPLLVAVLWLWGLTAQRQLVIKIAIALAVSLFVSWTMGHLFPHDRPFVENIGYNFLHHAADDSFPSDHGTVIFTFALAFLCWHRLWSGALLMAIAAAKGIDLSIVDKNSGRGSAVPPDARYSTLQDIDAGRHTEIDMFSGALMRMGKELGIPTPYNEYTYHMIKALEEKNDGLFDYSGKDQKPTWAK